MKKFLTFVIINSTMTGCFIGAGTHGHIESYKMMHSNEEIVTIVDQFLLSNPEYFDTVEEDFGWIYIKIPPENNRFGFRIGGQSEIDLIAAGRDNERTYWDKDLSSADKEEFINVFKTQFIDKLTNAPKSESIIKRPFILSINKDADTDIWPHYVFETDTVLSYPLPDEFDSLDIDFFEDLVASFGRTSGQESNVNQFHNIFRISKDYSGYVGDSIYITKLYRTIGRRNKTAYIFNSVEWIDYVDDGNRNKRIKDYIRLRKEKTDNGYSATDVYSKFSEERWMINSKHLKRGTNGS